jgi:DNA-binding YbaB/EbfC family protein
MTEQRETRDMDLNALMQQAQAMQQKLQDAQAKLGDTLVEGSSGGGLVRVTLAGTGELKAVTLDDSVVQPGEAEILADLLVAAHADAKRKLDEAQARLMQEAAGPMAGMMGGAGGMPGFPGMKL